MSDVSVRLAQADDLPTIIALNDLAFGGRTEGQIVQALLADGDDVLSLVAQRGDDVVGHIQFFRIWVDGDPVATGLGPMSVAPTLQKSGIGGQMIQDGLARLEAAGESLVFVLGHPEYYPKYGFTAEKAAPFTAPWSGPAFMAQSRGETGPAEGTLTYPKAFGVG